METEIRHDSHRDRFVSQQTTLRQVDGGERDETVAVDDVATSRDTDDSVAVTIEARRDRQTPTTCDPPVPRGASHHSHR